MPKLFHFRVLLFLASIMTATGLGEEWDATGARGIRIGTNHSINLSCTRAQLPAIEPCAGTVFTTTALVR